MLRRNLKPAPHVGFHRPPKVVGLRRAKRKHLPQPFRVIAEPLRVGHDQWLALPAKPEVWLDGWVVEVAGELPNDLGRLPERAEKRHLRCLPAVATHASKDVEQGFRIFRVGVLIGDIEDHRVDASIGEHLGMLCQHIRVVGVVVAKDRLTPVVRAAEWPPERVAPIVHRPGMLRQNL